MANIRTYESNAVLHPDDMAEQAAAQGAYHAEREAEIVPHLVEQGFEKVQSGLDKMQEKQDQAQTTAALSTVATQTISDNQNLFSTIQNGDTTSNVNPLSQFSNDFDEQTDKLSEQFTAPKAQEAFMRARAEAKRNIMDRGSAMWQERVKADTETNLGKIASSYTNATIQDPASVGLNVQQYSSSIDTYRQQHPNALSQADADRMKRGAAEDMYNSAAMRMISTLEQNPQASLKDMDALRVTLGSDEFRDNMSPKDYLAVQDHLSKAYGQRQDVAMMVLKDQAPSLLKQVEINGDPQGTAARTVQALQANARTPAEQAAALELGVKLNDSLTAHQVRTDIADMSPTQVQAYLMAKKQGFANETDPMKVSQQRTAYDTAQRVAKEQADAYADPKKTADYVVQNNDTVGALYLKYQQNPSPQTFQAYAMHAVADQDKHNPGGAPTILTSDMKQKFASQMAGVDQTPQGALNAATALSGLKQTTGPYYTGVVHELQKDHIINPSQYVAGVLINRPESQMLAQEVLQAAAVPKDALDKTSPLDESRALAVARNAFAPLASTMKGTVNGSELLDSYISATAAVLRQRATYAGQQYIGTRAGGQNDVSFSGPVAADATALANQMVMGRYSIKAGMRIPSNLDAGDVVGGAQSVLGDLGNHKLVASPYYGSLINGGQQFAKDIQSDGYWVTNPKGDGATLYFQGAPVQEHDDKGMVRTISIPFDQMQTLGRQSRGVLDKARRFFTNPGSL